MSKAKSAKSFLKILGEDVWDDIKAYKRILALTAIFTGLEAVIVIGMAIFKPDTPWYFGVAGASLLVNFAVATMLVTQERKIKDMETDMKNGGW